MLLVKSSLWSLPKKKTLKDVFSYFFFFKTKNYCAKGSFHRIYVSKFSSLEMFRYWSLGKNIKWFLERRGRGFDWLKRLPASLLYCKYWITIYKNEIKGGKFSLIDDFRYFCVCYIHVRRTCFSSRNKSEIFYQRFRFLFKKQLWGWQAKSPGRDLLHNYYPSLNISGMKFFFRFLYFCFNSWNYFLFFFFYFCNFNDAVSRQIKILLFINKFQWSCRSRPSVFRCD